MAKLLREETGEESWSLYVEDAAPGHTGDKCVKTDDIGLKAVRRQCFAANFIIREIIPENAGPDFAGPDQMFKVLKMMSRQVLQELTGCGDDLASRPRDEVALKHGGPVFTDAGNFCN